MDRLEFLINQLNRAYNAAISIKTRRQDAGENTAYITWTIENLNTTINALKELQYAFNFGDSIDFDTVANRIFHETIEDAPSIKENFYGFRESH